MLKTALKGKDAILYPLLLQLMTGVMQIAMVMALIAAVIAMSADLESVTGISAQAAWKWSCFLSMPVAAFWIFSAACRLRWWRGFEASHKASIRQNEWIIDLPAVLGIDLICGGGRTVWSLTLSLSVIGMILNGSVLGVCIASLSALCLMCLGILEQAWMAERMITGASLRTAFVRAVRKIASQPIKTLAVYIVPGALTITASGASVLLAFTENSLGMMLMYVIALLVPCFIPVFWLHLMRTAPKNSFL